MAGGTFVTMNKVRPGAYINFESVPKPLMTVAERGVVTMPVAMEWGPSGKMISLLSEDLLNGNSVAKIGCDAFDAESLVFREALKNAYKAYIYRADTGGEKATATIGTLTASALYAGVVGNKITVAVVAMEDKFKVQTFLDGALKDEQIVSTIAELTANDWVEFSGEGKPTANAGTQLAGGTNGTVNASVLTDYFKQAEKFKWNTMAIPLDVQSTGATVTAFIKRMRDTLGRKCQAVVVDYPNADYEGIISVSQGYKTSTEEITKFIFAATVAGMTAGANVNESNTYAVVDADAVEIVGELTDEEIKEALQSGKFIISRRDDDTIVVEQDINTFKTFVPKKGKEFAKNRVIRCLDEINNTTKLTWEKSYVGKVDNNADGRDLFKADLINFGNQLQNLNAITDFNGTQDIVVSKGQNIEDVIADWAITPVDAMEKLYMTVRNR